MAAAIITSMQLATTSWEGSSPGLVIVSVYIPGWLSSFVHICLHLQAFVFVHGQSHPFVGGGICLRVFVFIHGQLCSFLSVCVHLWAVVMLARCGCGLLVGGGGVAPHGRSWWWQGGVAGCCE